MTKIVLAALVSALAVAAATACAQAAAEKKMEFCPASANAAHKLVLPGRTLFTFDIGALSVRTVSGEIVADTNAGFYAFPFTDVTLAPDAARYKTDTAQYTRVNFVSKELFAGFPAAVTRINAWWVRRAQSTGDAFNWEAKGSVDCLPPAGTGTPPKRGRRDEVRLSQPPNDFKRAPSEQDVVYQATPAKPLDTSCPKPFANAAVVDAISPQWPSGWTIDRAVTAEVEVAISAEGKLEGAWIYQPSGTTAFDLRALQAAQSSTYAAGTAYCMPAPGTYLFSATFEPRQ